MSSLKDFKILYSKRLIIRPLAIKDSFFILELVNSEGWLKYIGDRNVQSLTDSNEYIQSIINNNKSFYFVFEDQKSREVLGIISFLFRNEYKNPDLGFALLPQYEKKGYTYEACNAFLEELRMNGMNPNIIAITMESNIASISLLVKLGFKKSDLPKTDNLIIFSKDLTSGI